MRKTFKQLLQLYKETGVLPWKHGRRIEDDLPHYEGGKDAELTYGTYQLPELTVTGKLAPPKQQPLYRNPYHFNQKRWVTSSTKLTDYDDLEKIYTAATAGLVPNVLTAARNFAQGDLAQGFVNLGWASEPRYAEDGTLIWLVAPGILTGTGNAGNTVNMTKNSGSNIIKNAVSRLKSSLSGIMKRPTRSSNFHVDDVPSSNFSINNTSPLYSQETRDLIHNSGYDSEFIIDWNLPEEEMLRRVRAFELQKQNKGITLPAKTSTSPVLATPKFENADDRADYILRSLNENPDLSIADLVSETLTGSKYPHAERSELASKLLDRLNIIDTYNNLVSLLEHGINYTGFDRKVLEPGELYNSSRYNLLRVLNSIDAGRDVEPYLASASDNLRVEDAYDIAKKDKRFVKLFQDNLLLDEAGNARLEYLPYDWGGNQEIFNKLTRDAAELKGKYGSELEKIAYKSYLRKYGPNIKEFEFKPNRRGEAIKIPLGAKSKTSAAYFYDDPKLALSKAKYDFEALAPGQSWALLDDGALSADSYTLLEALTRRHQDAGSVLPLYTQDGQVAMQVLNQSAERRGLQEVQTAVKNLESTLGMKLPIPFFDKYHRILAPAFFFTRNLK